MVAPSPGNAYLHEQIMALDQAALNIYSNTSHNALATSNKKAFSVAYLFTQNRIEDDNEQRSRPPTFRALEICVGLVYVF